MKKETLKKTKHKDGHFKGASKLKEALLRVSTAQI